MTSLITQPQLLATAASDASAIGSALNEAKAAAAGPTTSLAAAAEDEVSAVAAQFFGAYGQEYQALLHQAAAYHNQFAATLAAAGNAYAQAEAQIAGTLSGLTWWSAVEFRDHGSIPGGDGTGCQSDLVPGRHRVTEPDAELHQCGLQPVYEQPEEHAHPDWKPVAVDVRPALWPKEVYISKAPKT